VDGGCLDQESIKKQLFFFITSCRPEEIYRLQKSNINLDGNFLTIQDGKTKAAHRRIPLTARQRQS
jgi:integrase